MQLEVHVQLGRAISNVSKVKYVIVGFGWPWQAARAIIRIALHICTSITMLLLRCCCLSLLIHSWKINELKMLNNSSLSSVRCSRLLPLRH